MITTTQQKNKIVAQLEKLKVRLDTPAKAGVPSHIARVTKVQIQESISDLEAELDAYEKACRSDLNDLTFNTYAEMLRMPITVRLASRLSVARFATIVGVSESQIKRYEANEYRHAPADVIDSILKAFNMSLNGHASRCA